jgi:pregnancy-associated plasma protein-A
MRKLILSFAVLAVAIIACQPGSDEIAPSQEAVSIDMSDFYVYTDDNTSSKATKNSVNEKCFSMHVLNRQLDENPGLYTKMYAIEEHTRRFIAGKKPTNPGGGNGNGNGNNGNTDPGPTPFVGSISIPVYVHVVYSNLAQNISDLQINSQITVLNNDFNDTDYGDIPDEFKTVAADIDINFTLDNANIARHSDSKSSWGTNDAVKIAYPPVSGYLNIWVCNIGGNILGYAQFPGGDESTDGIVIGSEYFGITSGSYGTGRTTTHEVGHWLNLRHIWGDGRCRQDCKG